jgi:hypothetical protein
MFQRLLVLLVATLAVAAHAFVPAARLPGRSVARADVGRSRGGVSMMGGKVAKFGIFSPAVIVAKIVLGEQKLNKIRGKAIALHSQAITEFCYFVGAQGKMRNRVIKKAKTNGDDLGFLW